MTEFLSLAGFSHALQLGTSEMFIVIKTQTKRNYGFLRIFAYCAACHITELTINGKPCKLFKCKTH